MPETITISQAHAAQFIDAFAEELAEELAEHMACREVDAIADLLEVLGRKEAADRWRKYHDEADGHHNTVDPGEPHYKGDDAGALITTH